MSVVADTMITMKVCRCCGRERALDEYYVRTSSGDLHHECKDCYKERMARYRAKNREVIRSKATVYNRKNVDLLRMKANARYWKDPDFFRRAQREYTAQNSEAINLRRDPAKARDAARRRRAVKREADLREITTAQWKSLVRQYRGMCAYCGVAPWEHRDHVIPLYRGGRHSIGNILPSCCACNQSKGKSTVMEWRKRKNDFH